MAEITWKKLDPADPQPPPGFYLLAHATGRNSPNKTVSTGYMQPDGKCCAFGGARIWGVTHYAALPEAPKEEEV